MFDISPVALIIDLNGFGPYLPSFHRLPTAGDD
jgi:hypothetical protein